MKALVTGGGGFLGGAIVRQLLDAEFSVTSLSRNPHPWLDVLGVSQVAANIDDPRAVEEAIAGHELVFHVAARAGAWGPRRDYFRTNVLGTQHVLAACRQHDVKALVYTSTPSVVFAGRPIAGGDERLPYPQRFAAFYPETKAEAEREVLAERVIPTTALRPHLIWGPGDGSLLPRIVRRARADKLRRILVDPPAMVDATYVADAARAHLLAATSLLREGRDAPCCGRPYFISAAEPIEVFAMIDHLLTAAGESPLKRTVSRRVARLGALVMEASYRLLGRTDEPPLTRWVVDNLTHSHHFDIGAARRDLGFEPKVSLAEGLAQVKVWVEAGGLDR